MYYIYFVTVRKQKPVLKRTETYEDRCRLLIGLTDTPDDGKAIPNSSKRKTSQTTENQTSTSKVSSFNKTTSDLTFDKKSIQTAQKDTGTSKVSGPSTNQTKNRPRGTDTEEEVIVTDDETIERRNAGYMSDTVSSSVKKVHQIDQHEEKTSLQRSVDTGKIRDNLAPAGKPSTTSDRFTSFENDVVKVTRSADHPKKSKTDCPRGIDTEEEVVITEDKDHQNTSTEHSYMSDTVSSTFKKHQPHDEPEDRSRRGHSTERPDHQDSTDKPQSRGTTPQRTTHAVSKVSDTEKFINTERKTTSQHVSEGVSKPRPENLTDQSSFTEEEKRTKTTSYASDTFSSKLKKVPLDEPSSHEPSLTKTVTTQETITIKIEGEPNDSQASRDQKKSNVTSSTIKRDEHSDNFLKHERKHVTGTYRQPEISKPSDRGDQLYDSEGT